MAFVIKEHRPGRLRLILILLALGWIASGAALYRYGWSSANTAYDEAVERELLLKQEVQELTDSNRELQRQKSVLSRSAQVDREAKIEIAKSMQALEQEITGLREQVGFYKGIVSPQSGKSGLDVYSFKVMQADGELYHYSLVLIQAGKADRLAQGHADIQITGVSGKQEQELALKDIDLSDQRRIAYKFKYFEKLDGSFRLPVGYYPRSIVVTLLPTGSKASPVSKTYDWAETRAGEL